MSIISDKSVEIIPSILAADPLNLRAAADQVVAAQLSQVHVDVMDGHFVPNLSFGPSLVKRLHEVYPALFLDVHLMISNPDQFATPFIASGAGSITVHVELEKDILQNVAHQIQASSCKMGLAINPETRVDALYPYLEQTWITSVLIMSVHPGFGGQAFIDEVLPKLKTLRSRYPHLRLCLDGGINRENAERCVKYGADALVMGSQFFKP